MLKKIYSISLTSYTGNLEASFIKLFSASSTAQHLLQRNEAVSSPLETKTVRRTCFPKAAIL